MDNMDSKEKVKDDKKTDIKIELASQSTKIPVEIKEKTQNDINNINNDDNNNDNNNKNNKTENEVLTTNNIKQLKEYNTNRLVINKYWIELISKICCSSSIMVFESMAIIIIPLIFGLLDLEFKEIKKIVKEIMNDFVKWFFIYTLTQQFSIGFFCLRNFSTIFNEKDKPIKFLIFSLIKAIIFYLITIFILKVVIEEIIFDSLIERINEIELLPQGNKDHIIEVIKDIQKIVIKYISNLLAKYNHALDQLLIGSAYIALFSTPECLKGKKILFFRLLSILPMAYIILSLVLRTLYNLGIINLSSFVSPIFVGSKFTIFGFFISFLLFIKIRGKKYKIFDEENNIIPSVFAKISSKIFAIFGFIELVIGLFIPSLSAISLGSHYLLILCAPIMMLYDYKRTFEIHIKPCEKKNCATFISVIVNICLNVVVVILGIVICVLIIELFNKYLEPFVNFVIEKFDVFVVILDWLYFSKI